MEDIESETKKNEALISCKQAILENKWHVIRKNAPESIKQDIESLYRVRDELSISMEHDIVLRDRRIVIPESLKQRAIDIAHKGHQGIVKTKQLLRTKIWFSAIYRLVEQTVSACIPCQASTVERNSTEPLNMSELPNEPWEEISIDFKELPTGEYLLVVIDDYSRYPVTEVVRSTSATCIIPKLDTIFAAYGTPCVVRTDNGPPFNSIDFANFAKYLGFHHRKVTPLWPKANGEVERMMRNLKKLYRTAITEHQNWKQALNKYLRNFRATPHSSTGVAPASAMFGREVRTRLPEMPPAPKEDHAVGKKDKNSKANMKASAEKGKTFTKKPLCKGDFVLLKRDPSMEGHQTPYFPQPYEIVNINGSMITATDGARTVTRNVSFFKRLQGNVQLPPPDNDIDLDVLLDDHINHEPAAAANVPPAPIIHYPQRARDPQAYLRDYVM